jgi:WD40 repeat protein
VTLTHGVVLPISYVAEFADGYRADVTAATSLTADQPAKVTIAGNNVTVRPTAGACEVEVTGSYSYRGVTRTAQTTIAAHGPQSRWERAAMTPGGDVNAMAFSPDGTRLATGGSSGAICLYRVGLTPTQYEIEQVIPAHERPIQSLFYLPNTGILSVGADGQIRTWDLADTSEPVSAFAHDAAITCAAYRDGLVAFGDNLGRVLLLDTATNALRWTQSVHTGGTTCVALDADTVFSGGQDSTAALLRRANGEVLQRYPGFAKPLVAVGYLDGTTYALSEDKRLVTWTKGTADDNLWEYFFPAAPTALNWSGGRLYVSTDPNSTWVYDANMLLLRWIEHPPERGRIGCLAVSPDGTYLLTGRSSTVAEKVDRRTGKKVQELSDLHGIQFWNAARGSYAGSLEHSYSLSDARVTEDGSLLFTQSSKRTCKYTLGMPFTGERFLETGYFVPFDFAGLETTDDGAGLLATRVADSIYIMDMAARLLDMSVHTTCSRFAISLDGTRLLTNSPGSLTRFWDIAVDFPTVTHENPVFSYDLEFANGGDSLGSMPDDSFVSIFNAAGLRYSGIHVAIATSEGGGSASPPLPEDLSVSRGSQRCALVVRQKLESQLGTTWYSYVQVYDLSDRLAPVRLFEKYLGSSENVKPRVVATLSDDGSLLFYGAERVSGGEADVSLGHLVDLNTGNLLYVFSPPSAGSASNQGLAAAQFTRNDSALMVAWKEGYAEVYERRGMLRIEVSPQARTVPPASFVDLTAVAVYADGSSRDVSERVALAADRPSLVTLAGNRVTVKSGTAAGQQIQITASYSELGSTRTAVSTITAGSPTFLSLSVDPARLSLAPGGSASLHFFAHFAGGTTTEVTTGLSLTADPADRLTIAGTTVQVPALAQAGMAVVTARYLTQGDERSVQAFVNIQPPLESTNPGDFDHDRDVDFNDLTFFVGHYGETTSSPSWNSSCDFDRDGDVDFNDITYFAGIYGTSYGARKAFEVSAKAVGEAGPLVRVWLEGPATAKVGDSFQVRVYVEDASATATGVRGGPLDIFFDPALTACVLPFDPYRILQAPFNEMITHGRLLDGRIDELGGVTIESGLGDGVPVLYAVLSFRALAAGTAEFAATSGESGLSLAPPVGQVGLDLESFGSALAVMIQAGDSPPDGTDADDAMLDGLNGELYLLRGETAVRTLTFGVRAGATAAFDPAEGDLPAGPVGADGEEAFFVTAGGELLAADVRGPAPRIEWRVAVSAPAGAPGPWALAWQPPSDLPADRQMALIPTDDTWLPAGPPLDPEENGTLALPQDGIGRTEARYLLVVERLRPFTVHLNAGWNVLGISLEPTAASQEDFLNDPRVVVAWRWDPVTGYQIATDLQAHAGYWVYAAEACDLELRGVRPAASAVRLAQGWNLVAPSVVAESATAFPGVSSCWAWDAQTGGCFAVNPAPAGGRPCQPGAAYWVYASEDGALIWDR